MSGTRATKECAAAAMVGVSNRPVLQLLGNPVDGSLAQDTQEVVIKILTLTGRRWPLTVIRGVIGTSTATTTTHEGGTAAQRSRALFLLYKVQGLNFEIGIEPRTWLDRECDKKCDDYCQQPGCLVTVPARSATRIRSHLLMVGRPQGHTDRGASPVLDRISPSYQSDKASAAAYAHRTARPLRSPLPQGRNTGRAMTLGDRRNV